MSGSNMSRALITDGLSVPFTEGFELEMAAAATASPELMTKPTSAAARASKSFTPSPQNITVLFKPCKGEKAGPSESDCAFRWQCHLDHRY